MRNTIRTYMKKRMKYEVEEEELTYLTMHIAENYPKRTVRIRIVK